MKFHHPLEFTGKRPWAALDIANIDGVTVRVHWTDQPYRWHVNDGQEVFVVLDGEVDMHYRRADGSEAVQHMRAGGICHAESGDAHVAHPCGSARVLVVEREGSI